MGASKLTTLKVAVLCGGPSPERGISLNSARSLCDHLVGADIELTIIYFDYTKQAYLISHAQLYSNTPSDFDFKLQRVAETLSEEQLAELLKNVDIAFPAVHGMFGEDGELQALLAGHDCLSVGAPEEACRRCFDKYRSQQELKDAGFLTIPTLLLEGGAQSNRSNIAEFFSTHALARAIVKPARAGSSIGVNLVSSPEEALRAADEIFNAKLDQRVVVEPFLTGTEFTVIILENSSGSPVALIPTEIELESPAEEIFDYRKKYLATRQVTYHSPPRFSDELISEVQNTAEKLFAFFGMQDFARFDGWVLEDGRVLFSDFNPVSGMEQNSFLFIQGSQVGMSHRSILRYILNRACARHSIPFEASSAEIRLNNAEDVKVIFGGTSAERHVSLMSGTNVWLKLRRSNKYLPKPFLLEDDETVWQLPYSYALYHTTEEILERCRSSATIERRIKPLRESVIAKLGATDDEISEQEFTPVKMSLAEFISRSKLVFIALHGGIGENGILQSELSAKGVSYTGPDAHSSALCVDKYKTAQALKDLESQGIYSAKKRLIDTESLSELSNEQISSLWQELITSLCAERRGALIVKPVADGCSAGVARLMDESDLEIYLRHLTDNAERILPGALSSEKRLIEMPPQRPQQLLFEDFIETDKIEISDNKLIWERRTGWVETTMGVLGLKGQVRALNPSITVATGSVLTLEEKFQGGTGVNITPLPEDFVPRAVVNKARAGIELVASSLGIGGFSRIDAFLNIENGDLIIIEANTIPGLTPSTVIFHQALAEDPALQPEEFLEKILEYRNRP